MRSTIPGLVLLAAVAASSCNKDPNGRSEIHRKLTCDSNDSGELRDTSLTLTAEEAKEFGEALAADGNCNATLVNIALDSPTVAVRAGGNTHLVFEGGRIKGGEAAFDVSGNAHIELKGTEVIGEIRKSGNADVIGLDTAKKPAADDSKAGAAEPAGKAGGDDKKAGKKDEGGW